MKNAMVIKKDLGIVEYAALVNGIANEFFNENEEYVPHFGKMNAMRLFYNECVKESKFDLPHDFKDALQLNTLIQDDEFMEAFHLAIQGDGKIRLDFANAYADAMEMVNARKSTLGNALALMKNAIAGLADEINSMPEKENTESLKEIANHFADGALNPEAIVKALGGTEKEA